MTDPGVHNAVCARPATNHHDERKTGPEVIRLPVL